MIEYKQGSVLDAPAGSVIVHGCNAQGVMGSGVALAVKKKYPEAFEVYLREFYTNKLSLGSYTEFFTEDCTLIVNAITQFYYGRAKQRYVDYEAVAKSFDRLYRSLLNAETNFMGLGSSGFSQYPLAFHTIAFPKIGAGLGGGSWDVISAIIEEAIPDTGPFKKVCYEI